MIADGGIVLLWIGGLFLAAFLVFLVTALVVVAKMLGFVFRGLFGGSSPRRAGLSDGRACPNRRCGHVNPPEARFCARCGRPMRSAYDTDLYG